MAPGQENGRLVVVMDGENPSREPPPRVRFGPRDTQTLPAEWAEIMLAELCQRNRKLFGDLLSMAAIDGRNGANGSRG